jgi:hypothetical protein
MAKQVITLHLYESTQQWDQGRRSVFSADFRQSGCLDGRIWLGQQDVEIDWPEVDTRQLQIDALEAQLKQERAESQSRVNLLLERISKLQAIGHEVAE